MTDTDFEQAIIERVGRVADIRADIEVCRHYIEENFALIRQYPKRVAYQRSLNKWQKNLDKYQAELNQLTDRPA